MKKTLLIIIILFNLQEIYSQEIYGKAEYQSKYILKKQNETSKENETRIEEFEREWQNAIKKETEKKYLLTFNNEECLYEQTQELEKPSNPSKNSISISISISGSNNNKYINYKENRKVTESEILGKQFLIIDELKCQEWKLLNQTKKIGEFECYKAETIIKVSENELKEYDDYLKKEQVKPSLFKLEKPKDQIITAWYTSEIPISFGPNNFCGLPGLILEINDGNLIILCTKITLKKEEKTKIKEPKKGKKVTQKEFDAIELKKMELLNENQN